MWFGNPSPQLSPFRHSPHLFSVCENSVRVVILIPYAVGNSHFYKLVLDNMANFLWARLHYSKRKLTKSNYRKLSRDIDFLSWSYCFPPNSSFEYLNHLILKLRRIITIRVVEKTNLFKLLNSIHFFRIISLINHNII